MRALTKRALKHVFRARAYVIFSRDCRDAVMPSPLDGEVFSVLTRENLADSASVAAALLALSGENAEYLADIRRGRIVGFVISYHGKVVHFSYLFLRNKTACILGLDGRTALIGNAYTTPAYRGKGAQARSVKARAWLAHNAGFDRIAAETDVDNLASQAGIKKGGMQMEGRMDVAVFMRAVVIRRRRPAGFAPWGLCIDWWPWRRR